MKVTYVSVAGTETTIDAEEGDNLMQPAVASGIDGIVGECGGSMMCATCHVYVDEAWAERLPPRSAAEAEMLDCAAAEVRLNSRLSCQIQVAPGLDGLTLHLPDSQQ